MKLTQLLHDFTLKHFVQLAVLHPLVCGALPAFYSGPQDLGTTRKGMPIPSEATIRDSSHIMCVPVLRFWIKETVADTLKRFAPSPVDPAKLLADQHMQKLKNMLISSVWCDLVQYYASYSFFFAWMQRTFDILEQPATQQVLGAIALGSDELATVLVAVLRAAYEYLRSLTPSLPWLALLVEWHGAVGSQNVKRAVRYYITLGFEPPPEPVVRSIAAGSVDK